MFEITSIHQATLVHGCTSESILSPDGEYGQLRTTLSQPLYVFLHTLSYEVNECGMHMHDGFRTTVNKLYYSQYCKLYIKRGMFHVKHPYLVI